MSNNKISTAKEIIHKNFWNGKYVEGDSLDTHEKLMIEFAKLHVQAALEKAGEKYKGFHTLITPNIAVAVLEDVYPLENIK